MRTESLHPAAVALVHGFPDGPESWTAVADKIRAAGRDVQCRALPGYGHDGSALGERKRPAHAGCFIQDLAIDVVHRDMPNADGVHLVGHDWGGVLVWLHDWGVSVDVAPMHVLSVSIIGAPHPCGLHSYFRAPGSAYARALARRWLPELWLRWKKFEPILEPLRAAGMGDNALAGVRRRCEDTTRLMHMLAPYRALGRLQAGDFEQPWPAAVPLLLLRGDQDPYIDAEHMLPPNCGFEELRVATLPDTGHWPHIQSPDLLATRLLSFWADVESRA